MGKTQAATLIEGRTLYLPGRAKTMHAPSSFRLWGTVTSQPRASRRSVASQVFRSALWQHLVVPAPSAPDLTLLVATRFPAAVDIEVLEHLGPASIVNGPVGAKFCQVDAE